MPETPTPWRGACTKPSRGWTESRPCSRAKANAVFVELPAAARKGLVDRGWKFYTFIGSGGCRFMCSWDTTAESVDRLTADIRDLVAA